MFKQACAALALVGAMASAHADATLISEGFDNVANLTSSGWQILNLNTPAGLTSPWVQGDETVFTALSGAGNSYISSNFNNAAAGGSLASWLITPVFSTAENLVITFWAKADIIDGYYDQLAFGLVDAAGNPSSLVLDTQVTVTGDWSQYTLSLAGLGAGTTARFAIEYVGSADLSNYVGVDNLAVTAVPEPGSFALAGLGLIGLVAVRRRRQAR
ncbi:PEP-CTERM protein-sorting domain-containing protein/MYXO-CTERM domain-containing protein [Roseateles sp. YR242]|uniref:choice-of-anchor J family PEP-CTERM protein n=1 Tax=Roseateles sp. YR242 TaxID=1855305 RepID=UPI0008B340EC|nr:choice-of-anchor J domain-containing protein [Roseateles sp. YR242]SEL83821.1 PEP-CTERM protein-sorting domain-containing protein/MYXO-CTERM domain-containing protein [Roseateles sp. YR242]